MCTLEKRKGKKEEEKKKKKNKGKKHQPRCMLRQMSRQVGSKSNTAVILQIIMTWKSDTKKR